ncbi:MAG TPA: polysaccharide biosynthesis/export family protein [Anaeromyxobacteraceae bacterium]|nr:polysaccharide biosynthesis/export family protein [Anaeromyxobacteraceae bacterium]
MRRAIPLALLLSFAACAGRPAAAPVAPAPAEATPGEALAASALGPGDVFEVRVYGEPELSGVYRVGSQGDIVFPLCRRVMVSGLSANETAERLRACLADGYIRNAQVSVIVKEYNSKKIFVFGEVQKPGTFVYEDGMTVIQAVTLAGGFMKTAAPNSTSVTRLVDGQEMKIRVPVQDIALGKATNVLLRPGDIVFVPESLF